jgi:integrase
MARTSKGPHLVQRRGIWHITWADGHGRSPRSSTGTRDRGEAEQALAAFILESGQPTAKPLSLVVLLDRYIADRWPAGPPNAELHARKHLAAHFLGKTVADLNPAASRAYIAARPVKDTTSARELTVLRAALQHAVKEGVMTAAPFVAVPSPAEPRDRWLTPAEFGRLRAGATLPHIRLFIYLAIYTAARHAAVLDLTWDRVDLVNGRIDYNPVGRARTSKGRPVVPINAPLRKALLAARPGALSDYVVEYEGERVRSIKRAFAKACERAKLVDVIPHTLRHTAATWMAQRGVSIIEIAGILGQSIQRTTERYIKHHPDHLKAGVDALAWNGRESENPDDEPGIDG